MQVRGPSAISLNLTRLWSVGLSSRRLRNKQRLSKTQTKQKQNKKKINKKPVKAGATKAKVSRKTMASKTIMNPYSRFAGPLPTLTPAGQSVRLFDSMKTSIKVSEKERLLLICSNFGLGRQQALWYKWEPTTTTTAATSGIINLMGLPAPGGTCIEMRPSKLSLMMSNLSPPLQANKYAWVLTTTNRPKTGTSPNSASVADSIAALNSIYDQVFSRPETLRYNLYDSSPREVVATVADYENYIKYNAPATIDANGICARSVVSTGITTVTDVPMTAVFMIFDGTTAGATNDNTLVVDLYSEIRARYMFEDPLSKMVQPAPVATPKQRLLLNNINGRSEMGAQFGTYVRA